MASFDPVEMYLQDVDQFPRLTSAHEQELLALAAEGDTSAGKRLRESVLRFVADTAIQARPEWMDPLDAIVEGNVALVETLQARPSGDLHAAIRNAIEERLSQARNPVEESAKPLREATSARSFLLARRYDRRVPWCFPWPHEVAPTREELGAQFENVRTRIRRKI